MGERLIHLNQIGGGVVDEEQAEEEHRCRANHQNDSLTFSSKHFCSFETCP
jgi:hypothetical protein